MLKGNNSGNKNLEYDDLNFIILGHIIDIGDIDRVANTYVLTSAGSEGVLKEVSTSTDMIGVISFNQLLSLKSSFSEMEKIRILSVLNDKGGEQKYVLPSQASLSLDEY